MLCWCGMEEEDDNQMKWEVLRNILSASCQNGNISCQHVRYTHDESCCIKLQVEGVTLSHVMCNKSVPCCCLLTGIKYGVRQPRSHDCQLCIGHYLRERTSADVCLKISLGKYMKLILPMKSYCTVSLTIPVLLTVKRKVSVCSR
jgi:hypothetical protein